MAQDLIGRVQRLIVSPKAEWDAIDAESVEPQSVLIGYVAPLAAIPAIATVVGLGFLGPFAAGAAFQSALVSYVFALVWVFVFAFIINALAPTFGAEKNYRQAFKVAAYSPTAGWVAGVFMLIPVLSFLALIGALYSLYLLFVGLPKMMKPPADKALVYTLAAIVVAILASVLIGALVGLGPRAMSPTL
ncbi:Yip1 family protein [Amphiplicatus metriothermophilus]|uniref:Yip1 domain-containing protein n=1 Tax=Amphiplicatus metriothermophilus TaxID=1519374 RepID=A0A239PKD3_9PROT|nr:Yip1 family protein [Amphiplicatus metriothermophilus]MBB5517409.1 hypothetical protein [Amphiplicatus metriothermophilus]SNT68256.1 Yip1 domain-containing protein [Amphiplicatus metriothermophilus]